MPRTETLRSLSGREYDLELEVMATMKIVPVAIRRWKDGGVVRERFYTNDVELEPLSYEPNVTSETQWWRSAEGESYRARMLSVPPRPPASAPAR
jgi:hypothetical protein